MTVKPGAPGSLWLRMMRDQDAADRAALDAEVALAKIQADAFDARMREAYGRALVSGEVFGATGVSDDDYVFAGDNVAGPFGRRVDQSAPETRVACAVCGVLSADAVCVQCRARREGKPEMNGCALCGAPLKPGRSTCEACVMKMRGGQPIVVRGGAVVRVADDRFRAPGVLTVRPWPVSLADDYTGAQPNAPAKPVFTDKPRAVRRIDFDAE